MLSVKPLKHNRLTYDWWPLLILVFLGLVVGICYIADTKFLSDVSCFVHMPRPEAKQEAMAETSTKKETWSIEIQAEQARLKKVEVEHSDVKKPKEISSDAEAVKEFRSRLIWVVCAVLHALATCALAFTTLVLAWKAWRSIKEQEKEDLKPEKLKQLDQKQQDLRRKTFIDFRRSFIFLVMGILFLIILCFIVPDFPIVNHVAFHTISPRMTEAETYGQALDKIGTAVAVFVAVCISVLLTMKLKEPETRDATGDKSSEEKSEPPEVDKKKRSVFMWWFGGEHTQLFCGFASEPGDEEKASDKQPDEDVKEAARVEEAACFLHQQMQNLNFLLYMGMALLIADVAQYSAAHHWQMELMSATQRAFFEPLVTIVLGVRGAIDTLLLATIYLPAAFLLRERAVDLIPDDVPLEKRQGWLKERDLINVSLWEKLKPIAAVFTPLLTGIGLDWLKNLAG